MSLRMNAHQTHTKHSRRLPRWCAAVALSLLAAPAVLAAPTPVVTPVPPRAEDTAPTKSVFIDRANFGRDPFFPTSTRRGQVIETNSVVEPVANFGNLMLKGISGTVEKRLAIINNKTFEAGEEAELRINGQPVKVKCVEIREKSVIVSINGISKELSLVSRF